MISCSKNVDRLSMLPDEILAQILSLIPTKFAVRTSVLSKRWRYTWTFVKILDFDDCQDPFVYAFKLISEKPMLESLSLEVSSDKNRGKNYNFNIPTLKRLKLSWGERAQVIHQVVLNVPNLEYLFVGGNWFPYFVMADVSSLVEASISFCILANDHLWVELLRGLRGIESLSLEFIPFASFPFIFPNLKHLKLKSVWHCGQILQCLESCPELKHLSIEKPGVSYWIEPELVPACIRTKLTTLEFSSFNWQTCYIEFLEYVMENADVLKTVTITWDNSTIEEEARLRAQFFKLTGASRSCEIRLQGNMSHSTGS